MKKIVMLLALGAIVILSQAQNEILMEINGDKKITVEEFKRIYLKNNPNNENLFSRTSLEEYLTLFTHFKLKVYEAEQLGLHTRKNFVEEFQKYRNQLAEPYLVDQSISEQLYKEAYDRMFKAIRASHILIQLPPSPTPADTLTAYKRILDIQDRYNKGMPFEQLALAYSQDPSAKKNLGELGYFSAMRMVYPFETAAYQTPIGEVSKPVRTQFGYHLIKVTDTLTVQGPLDLQFIVVRVKPNDTANTAYEKINFAYERLKSGLPFSDAVQGFTEDQNSKANNGMLNNYEPGKMSPEFDSVAFRLKEKTFSEPFYSRFNNAWFIVYVNKINRHPKYEEAYDLIKRRVSRMPHSNIRSKKLAERLLKEYKVERIEKAFNQVVDTLILMKNKQRSINSHMAPNFEKPIMVVNDTFAVKQFEFLHFAFMRLKLETSDIKAFCNELWPEFTEREIIKYEEQVLPVKYPEFKHILQEYHDGILLFNLTDSLVWQRAIQDTAGLSKFFETIKDRYRWNERYEALVIITENVAKQKAIEKTLKKLIKSGTSVENFAQAVRQQLKDTAINLRVEKVLVESGQNRYVDQTKRKKGFYSLKTNENAAVWVNISNVLPPQPKKLNEVKGFVVAEYQNHLEKAWVKELLQKYPVIIHTEVYEKLIEK